MIALDSSALMAIVNDEAEAGACQAAIDAEELLLLAAATLTETLIVSLRRGLMREMSEFLDGLQPRIVPLTETRARAAATAFARWGRGMHRAGLNYGDCFAYALAKEHECPLLFVGDDFSRTDVVPALV